MNALPPVRPRVRYAWVWSVIWLAYLAEPLSTAWHQHSGARRWLGIAAVVAFGAAFATTFATARALRLSVHTGGDWLRWGLLSAGVLLTLADTALLGESGLRLFTFVGVMAMFLLPVRRGIAAVSVLLVGTAAAQAVTPGWRLDYALQFQIFIAAFAMWGVVQIIQRNAQLMAAREEIARLADSEKRLAVADERSRFARDLHDILGHSLTVVAVKAELAGRLVRRDPERAEAEIADVESLARQALADVRAAVSGYREVTLAGELANARAALTAAGIDADLPTAIDEVPPARRQLFGWVVREGVTNVVRHSGASRCRVRLTPSEVEITDNGQGSMPTVDSDKGGRHGLTGLRERTEAEGGTLLIGRSAEGGFALRVQLL